MKNININIMKNSPSNFEIIIKLLKKSICLIGALGISTLISLPILSQGYPLILLFQPELASKDDYRTNTDNLFDSLQKTPNFNTLVDEIKAVQGLTQILERDNFTLLAPNDDAFEALPDDIYDKFSQPENRVMVLRYHLIPGTVSHEDLERGEITTFEGEKIMFHNHNGKSLLNNAHAKFPSTVANNGVIIEIDRVLFPPNF